MKILVKVSKEGEIDLNDKSFEDEREVLLQKLLDENPDEALEDGKEDKRELKDFDFTQIHDALVSCLADDITFIYMDLSEDDFQITEIKEDKS